MMPRAQMSTSKFRSVKSHTPKIPRLKTSETGKKYGKVYRKVAIWVFLIASDCKFFVGLKWPMLAQLGLKAIVLRKNLRRPENPAARGASSQPSSWTMKATRNKKSPWNHGFPNVKSHEIPWNPMKSNEIPSNPMKSYEIPWNPMESTNHLPSTHSWWLKPKNDA